MKIKPTSVFFVTGGANGLAKAFAQRMHARGGLIAVADICSDSLNKLREELGEDRLLTTECDVKEPEQIEAATNAAVERFGRIDVCLTGAGIAPHKLMPASPEMFMNVIQTNLAGTFLTAQSCISHMRKNVRDDNDERGVVIMTSSICGTDGINTGLVPYSATKGGINGMTLPMAREVGPDGIRVITIAPGAMASPMHDNLKTTFPIAAEMLEKIRTE